MCQRGQASNDRGPPPVGHEGSVGAAGERLNCSVVIPGGLEVGGPSGVLACRAAEWSVLGSLVLLLTPWAYIPDALTSRSHLAIADKLKFWPSRYNRNLVLHVRYSKGRL